MIAAIVIGVVVVLFVLFIDAWRREGRRERDILDQFDRECPIREPGWVRDDENPRP